MCADMGGAEGRRTSHRASGTVRRNGDVGAGVGLGMGLPASGDDAERSRSRWPQGATGMTR